jgi:hypothetical protein
VAVHTTSGVAGRLAAREISIPAASKQAASGREGAGPVQVTFNINSI